MELSLELNAQTSKLNKRVTIDLPDAQGLENALEVTTTTLHPECLVLGVNGQKVLINKEVLLNAITEAERSLTA